MKRCTGCQLLLPESEFSKHGGFSNGRRSQCRTCAAFQTYKRKYGLSRDEYWKLAEKQGNKCRICGASGDTDHWGRLVVDHIHENGAIRGLLCHQCNSGLGNFHDSIDRLKSAIKYLEES